MDDNTMQKIWASLSEIFGRDLKSATLVILIESENSISAKTYVVGPKDDE